jgi:hypothetical protein
MSRRRDRSREARYRTSREAPASGGIQPGTPRGCRCARAQPQQLLNKRRARLACVGLSFRAGRVFVCAPMPSRRVFAVLAVAASWGVRVRATRSQLPEAPRTSPRPHGHAAPGPSPATRSRSRREPRVDRVLAPARVAAPDLAREQRRPERRDPDPADRAELRGVGLPHVGPWPYAQDIPMFWYGPGTSLPPGVVDRRSRSPGSRRRRRSCSGSRSARSTARR